MRNRLLAVTLVCIVTGCTVGCSNRSLQKNSDPEVDIPKLEEQKPPALEPDISSVTPEINKNKDFTGENEDNETTVQAEEPVPKSELVEVPAISEIVFMKDTEATRLMGGMFRSEVRSAWGNTFIDWDNSAAGTISGLSDVGDEWLYNDPKHKFGANIRVYYEPKTNYETVKEVVIVSNNGQTTADDSLPDFGDGWNRGGDVSYWDDDFKLTPENVNKMNCDEFQERIKYMTRRTILNLLGSPVGYKEADPLTEAWVLTYSPASEGDSVEGVDVTTVTVMVTFDEEFGSIPEVSHVLPNGEAAVYENY